MILPRVVAAVALVLLNGASSAQLVFRCGQAYQDSPCPSGKTVDVSDDRSDEQRESARAVTEKEAARGDALERSRLAEEKARRPAHASNIGPHAQAAKRVAEHRPPTPKHMKKKAGKTRLAPKKPPPSQAIG